MDERELREVIRRLKEDVESRNDFINLADELRQLPGLTGQLWEQIYQISRSLS